MGRELIFARFEVLARLERQHAADEHPGLVDDAFALQDIGNVADAGAVRNIDDLVLSAAGPASRSAVCRGTSAAMPTTASNTNRLKMALPMTTSGWRALRERRSGASTISGSSAERGLRGVMRLSSLAFASMDAAPVPFACACRCARGSPAPALPAGREYDTGAGIGEGFTVATGGGLTAGRQPARRAQVRPARARPAKVPDLARRPWAVGWTPSPPVIRSDRVHDQRRSPVRPQRMLADSPMYAHG